MAHASVRLAIGEADGVFYGVALADDGIVATAIGSSRESADAAVTRCLPAGVRAEPADESPDPDAAIADNRQVNESAQIAEIVAMLSHLEAGNEDNKRFVLSETYLPDRLRRVLYAAASIPIGYVSTYGNIARAAGSEARAVGRTMATNPLYPLVPCHRVVGADLTMVGYGGRQDEPARHAKLRRLEAEQKRFMEEQVVVSAGGRLAVYPVEWAIHAERERLSEQLPDAAQLPLFG